MIDYSVGIAGAVITLTTLRPTAQAGVNFWSYVDMLTREAQIGMLVSTLVTALTFWLVKRLHPNREEEMSTVEALGAILTLVIQRDCLVTRDRPSARILYFVAG